jgi:hypothetical protein
MKRKGGSLGPSLERGLNMYAVAAGAAGVAVLALAQPSEAKIIYTPAHRKLSLNEDFFLDLNHHGTNDFRFHITTSGEDCTAPHRGTCESWDAAVFFVYPQVKGDGVVGTKPYASALRAGVSVGSKAGFNTSRGSMGGVEYLNGLRYYGAWADSGRPVDHRYLGLEFIINGKIHYGWARFNVRIYRDPESTVTAVLTGYAYETIPGKPIIAGKTKGRDVITVEPSSLGRLAQGASGISAWRGAGSIAAAH